MSIGLTPIDPAKGEELPPAWREFIRFCRDLRHGEIEKLNIQDGVPVLAETITKKIKFTRNR
jgi:hypothetical protein